MKQRYQTVAAVWFVMGALFVASIAVPVACSVRHAGQVIHARQAAGWAVVEGK
jgi:hypothetical protein